MQNIKHLWIQGLIMAIERFELELISSKMVTRGTIELTLKRTDDVAFNFEPGQFITFLFDHEDGKIRRRSYSIASMATGSKHVEITASYVENGIATEHLFNMKPGNKYNAMGPAGKLVLKDDSIKRLVLIGTGTGIAPYRAMLPLLKKKAQQENLNIDILLGVQYREDALYVADFLEYSKKVPSLHFHNCLSRETSELKAHEHQGYVQNQFGNLNLDPENDIIYLCGNPNMIDDAYAKLTDLGFSTKSIRREKYISSN